MKEKVKFQMYVWLVILFFSLLILSLHFGSLAHTLSLSLYTALFGIFLLRFQIVIMNVLCASEKKTKREKSIKMS